MSWIAFILASKQILGKNKEEEEVKLQVGDTRVAFSRSLRSQIVLDCRFVFDLGINDLNIQVIATANENEFLVNTKAVQNYLVG